MQKPSCDHYDCLWIAKIDHTLEETYVHYERCDTPGTESFKCMASCGNQHILCLTFHTVSHDSVSISSTVHANYNQLQQFASNQSNCTEVFDTTLYMTCD